MGYILIIIVILFLVVFSIIKNGSDFHISDPKKRAGQRGEQITVNVIRSVLNDADVLLNNIIVTFEGKETELDNVVINEYGVFIIETKNYSGILIGGEGDYEWQKRKTTYSGYTYVKMVKNPIKQVKRQTYILARYLDYYGILVWVEGYAFFVRGNSPFESPYILTDKEQINRTIHTFRRNRLNAESIQAIEKVLVQN